MYISISYSIAGFSLQGSVNRFFFLFKYNLHFFTRFLIISLHFCLHIFSQKSEFWFAISMLVDTCIVTDDYDNSRSLTVLQCNKSHKANTIRNVLLFFYGNFLPANLWIAIWATKYMSTTYVWFTSDELFYTRNAFRVMKTRFHGQFLVKQH